MAKFPVLNDTAWDVPLKASVQQMATYNVLDYGAVANHVTDNAAFINAAITAANAAGGGTVLVPAAADVFATGSTITMKAGVTLRIEGTIKALASHAGVGVTIGDISNAVVVGSGAIDMNKAATTSSGGATAQNGIYIAPTSSGASFITIRDVTVKNSWQTGIIGSTTSASIPITNVLVEGVTSTGNDRGIDFRGIGDTAVAAGISTTQQIRVRRCTLTNNGTFGLRMRGVSHAWVENNTITDNGSATSAGLSMGAGSVGTTNDQCTDFVLSQNKVSGFIGASQWGIAVSARATRFTVANNLVSACTNGITIDVHDPNNTTTLIDANGTVNNNVALNSTGGTFGMHVNWCKHLTFTGNLSRGNDGTGITVTSSFGCTVTGNISVGNQIHGFDITGTDTGTGGHQFSGNYANNNGLSGTGSNYHTVAAPIASSYASATPTTAIAEVSLTSSTTETALLTSTIPANTASVGTTYRVTVAGLIDNVATSGTLTFRLRWGGTAGTSLAGFAIPSQAGAATGQQWFAEYLVTVRTVGASGSVVAMGNIRSQFSATSVAVGAAASTVSTASDADLVFSAQWATSSASNVCKLEVGAVEVVKV